MDEHVAIDYQNWRGERRERTIRPIKMFFGETEFHSGPQWFVRAEDLEKNETRDFAMADIRGWRSIR